MCCCCPCCSCIFLLLDSILGLTGLATIAGGVLILIDEKSFNSTAVILIAIGLIVFIIFIIGIKIPKRPILLCMYLFFVLIIFLFYAGLAVLVKLEQDRLIKELKKRVDVIDEEDFDKIDDYNTYIFIGACCAAGVTLLTFITAIIYYNQLKDNDNNEEVYNSMDTPQKEEKDVLEGIDHSINNQEYEKNENDISS